LNTDWDAGNGDRLTATGANVGPVVNGAADGKAEGKVREIRETKSVEVEGKHRGFQRSRTCVSAIQ
jgi:hypothetical protein